MPAGMVYNLDPLEVEKELYRVESGHRLEGGFNLDTTNLVAGSFLPPLAPLAVDFATRKAVAIKNVKVQANAAANATQIRIEKNSLAYVGMFLGNGSKAAAVTAIDKTNAAYDLMTISLGEAVVAGQILFETAEPAGVVAEVKGVYALTIGTKPAAGDKLSLDGIVYEYAAAEGDAVFAVGANAKEAAANIEDAVSAQYDGLFSVKAQNGKLIFTQLVGGVGERPALVVTPVAETGTLAATIATTTDGVAAVTGSVLEPLNKANFLNYARTKVESGATVDALDIAREIKEAKLYLPIASVDKTNMREAGSLFLFV